MSPENPKDLTAAPEEVRAPRPTRPIYVALGALAALVLLGQLKAVLLFLFGGLIVATALNALAAMVARVTRIPYHRAVA